MSAEAKTESDNADQAKLVEAANFRAAWRQSPEARKAVVGEWVLIAGCALSTLLGAAIGRQLAYSAYQQGYKMAIGAVAGLLISLYFGLLAFTFFRRAQMRSFSDRRLLAEAKADLDQAEADIYDESATDFATLWRVTQKRLDYYHRIATNQSERSFLYGQLAAGIGFSVLVACAIAAAFANSAAASITAGLLGVAGGGMAAYVGTTFVRSQETAADQLRAYSPSRWSSLDT